MQRGAAEGDPAPQVSEAAGIRGLLAKVPKPVWWALPELFALAGLAIAQPLLDVTGKAPDFFLLHRTSRDQILALVALILLGPPVALWLGEVLVGLVGGERLWRLAHLAVIAGLSAVLALEVAKKLTPLRGKKLALAALLVGLAVAWAYAKTSLVRTWLRFLTPAPLVFALLFATTSASSSLILPARSGSRTPVPVRTNPSRPLPPVVMVFFDEFPLMSLLDSSGQVDARVYPNFASFAAHSTWYRNATGIAGWTPNAVPGMLRGRWPGKDLKSVAPDISNYPDNLFTLFDHYYKLKVNETITQLCPSNQCGQTGTPSGFSDVAKETARVYKSIASPVEAAVDPAAAIDGSATPAPDKSKGPTAYFGNLKYDQTKRAEAFVDSIKASDPQPTLYFLHLLLPHAPWKYLPDGRQYNAEALPAPDRPGGVWPDAIQLVEHQRHLVQLAYTDRVLGTLIDRLKRQGLWDRALVLLTADHGEGFTPGDGTRGLGAHNAADLMWVPMFLKAPGQQTGRVDDRNWEHVDLLPTVADTVGLTIPWKVDGYAQNGPPRRLGTDKDFYNYPGAPLVRPGPPNFRKVLAGVTDTLIRAHQDGERGFYQFGATADWIYKAPDQVGTVVPGQVTVRLNGTRGFADVDPEGPLVPSIVAGEVTSGTPPAGSRLVVAVNGHVGATAGFYPDKENGPVTSFGSMVPDFLYQKGPGLPQLQLYLATRSGGGWRLETASIAR